MMWAKFKCWWRGYCLLTHHENLEYEAAPGLFFSDSGFQCVCCRTWTQQGRVVGTTKSSAPNGAKEAA